MITGAEFQQVVYGYWARRFGCDREDFNHPGTLVIKEEDLEESGKTVIYHIDQMSVLRIASPLAQKAGLPDGHNQDLGSLTSDILQKLVGDEFQLEIVSTLLDCFLDPKDFVPFAPGRGFTARRLDLEQEKAVLLHLLEDCSDEDLDLADIDLNDLDPVIYGIFTEGQMVAYASHYYWDDVIADIGVLVHPGFRDRGLGKAVVSSLCEWCFENEIVPMYRVFDFNSISIKLSRDIGFKELVIIKSIKTREKENS